MGVWTAPPTPQSTDREPQSTTGPWPRWWHGSSVAPCLILLLQRPAHPPPPPTPPTPASRPTTFTSTFTTTITTTATSTYPHWSSEIAPAPPPPSHSPSLCRGGGSCGEGGRVQLPSPSNPPPPTNPLITPSCIIRKLSSPGVPREGAVSLVVPLLPVAPWVRSQCRLT